MAPPETFVRDYFRNWNVPNFRNWQIGGNGFEFDSIHSPKYLGDLTTTCLLHNGLMAKMLLVDGPFSVNGSWKNLEKSQNTILIENSFNNAREIFHNNYPGVNVPMPKGLYSIKQLPVGSLHPAFVMNYIENGFYELDSVIQDILLKKRDEMINIAENRFEIGPGAHDPNNFVYSKSEDRIYLVGLSLWKKK